MQKEENYVVTKLPQKISDNLALQCEEEKRTCEVCGALNEKSALMCKKCSNYLKTKEECKKRK